MGYVRWGSTGRDAPVANAINAPYRDLAALATRWGRTP